MSLFEEMKGVFIGTDIEIRDGIVTITGAYVADLIRFTKTYYSAIRFLENICISIDGITRYPVIKFHEFFAMEIYTMFSMARENGYCTDSRSLQMMELLAEHTWLKTTTRHVDGIFDESVFGKVVNPKLKPLPVQHEFIRDIYYQKKTQYHLNGYLLSLPPGCGKSLTSLFLSAGLHKTHLVILCPLSLVNSVWVNEVENCFMGKKRVSAVTGSTKDAIDPKCDTIIANYESITKIVSHVKRYFPVDKTMIIVDECHNFKDINSKRTKELIGLTDVFPCKDILLMSGTPVKAFCREVLPILRILDPYYNDDVGKSLSAVCRYTQLINELMCRRLGFLMFRKTKEEVFTLPPKHEDELKIKLKNGNKFTATNVRAAMLKYQQERTRYYESIKPELTAIFFEILEWYKSNCIHSATELREYTNYVHDVKYLSEREYNFSMAAIAHCTRLYEDNYILPRLNSERKKQFRQARAVVKYVSLKVLGEVLGNVLGSLRIEMTSAMLDSPIIKKIIREAKKKTIMFSSYTDTLRLAEAKCRSWGFKPLLVDGSNSKQAREIADKFNKTRDLNPLIASLQVMSTGHTLNSANTVIFLNVPFRSVDYEQASDRCYRIGQDTEVYIYKLVLDTGNEPNLSTRMQDILAWSKQEFSTIVGDRLPEDMAAAAKNFGLYEEIPELAVVSDLHTTLRDIKLDTVDRSVYGFATKEMKDSVLWDIPSHADNALKLKILNDHSVLTSDGNIISTASLCYGRKVDV